jgi:hypothetical protein
MCHFFALSVLAAVLPFIWRDKPKKFIIASLLSLLVMLMTYQASSGIYLVMLAVTIFLDWLKKRSSAKKLVQYGVAGAACWVMALLIFHFCIQPFAEVPYNNQLYSLSGMAHGVLHNIKSYLYTIFHDTTVLWRVVIGLTIIAAIASLVLRSKRNRLAALVVGIAVFLLLPMLSCGAYVAVDSVPFALPRYSYAIGAVLAVFAVISVDALPRRWYGKILVALPALLMVYYFIVFAFSYCNALSAQKSYLDYRFSGLATDIEDVYSKLTHPSDMTLITNNGSFGYSRVTANHIYEYPIMHNAIIPVNNGCFLWPNLYAGYNVNVNNDCNNVINMSTFSKKGKTLANSNSYYDIYTDKNTVYLIFKKN